MAESLRAHRKLTTVYKAPGVFGALKEAGQAHRTMTREVVRAKNQLRAVFRTRGIRGLGQELYDPERRTTWLEQLSPPRRQRAKLYAEHLDNQLESLQEAQEWLRESAQTCSIIKVLTTAPGIGLIRAAQTVATVVTPHRFRTKRQFWAYGGLAVVNWTSSDWKPDGNGGFRARRKNSTRGLNRNHNPMLKEVFKGAALTVAVTMPEDPLARNYRRLVEQERVDPALARLTLARQIAAIVLAMWKKQEVYDPTRYNSSKAA